MKPQSNGILGAVVLLLAYGAVSPPAKSLPAHSNAAYKRSNSASELPGSTYAQSIKPACGECFRQKLIDLVCGHRPGDSSTHQPCLDKATARTTEFVIATLPDPTRTHLGLFFDRMVEAIEQGAQDRGYLFESSVMPWDAHEHPESTSIVERLQAEEYQRAREQWPGVMTFVSSDSDQPGRLFIFVVGEFPTGGIHRQQFAHALQLIGDFRGSLPSNLLILGPTFSGSLPALPALVDKPPGRVTAFSGTLSSYRSIHDLQKQHPDWLTFASFQENDRYMLAKVASFADRLGYEPRDIALLSEDETAYGKFAGKQKYEEKPGKVDSSLDDQVLKVYFPREISQLRSAYQNAASAVQSNGTPRVTLPIDFQSTGGDEDTVASFSSKQMPISQEAVLLGIVTELRARHSRFVVLRATDPMDELFLARYLRTAYAEGRIITMGSDLLFSRELQDSQLHGVLAVTTYPQVPRFADEFTDADSSGDVDRVFPSSFSIGTYYALSTLLSPDIASLRFGTPLTLPSSIDLDNYAVPASVREASSSDFGKTEAPPVFITVLGHNGFWPVDVPTPHIRADSTVPVVAAAQHGPNSSHTISQEPKKAGHTEANTFNGNSAHGDEGTQHPQLPSEWRIFQTVVIVLALGYLGCLLSASVLDPEQSVSKFVRLRQDPRSGAITVLGIDLLALLQIAAWPYFSRHFHPAKLSSFLWLLILELFSGVLIVLAATDLYFRGRELRGIRHWVWIFGVSAVIMVVVIPVTAGYFFGYPVAQFVYRSVHLTSGVSPLLPVLLLIASGIWWSWHEITGTACINERSTKLPSFAQQPKPGEQKQIIQSQNLAFIATAAVGGGSNANVASSRERSSTMSTQVDERAERLSVAQRAFAMESPAAKRLRSISAEANGKLARWMEPTIFDWRIHLPVAAAILTVGTLVVNTRYPLFTIEMVSYNRLIAILLLVSGGTTIASALQLRGLWQHTRRLLVALDSRPLRRGFTRMAGFSYQPIWRIGGSNSSDLQRALSREFEALQCAMANCVIPKQDKFQQSIVSILDHAQHASHRRDQYGRRILKPSLRIRGWWWGRFLKHDRALLNSIETFQAQLAEAVRDTLLYLQEKWMDERSPILENTKRDNSSHEELKEKADPASALDRQAVSAAEHFVCLHYVNYVLLAVMRIRSLITAISGLYVFTLAALWVYPFEPSLVIKSSMTVLLMYVGVVVASIYAGMARDTTLSYISDTEPGSLGRDFWLRMGSFIALPLLSLVAAQFPELSRFLFSWVQPALQSMR